MDRPAIRLRVDEPLRAFLPVRHRGGELMLALDGTSTLGHLVQSAGIPLTEVGVLLLGDAVLPASYRPRADDVVEVEAVARPQPLPPGGQRFLLDGHLGALARRMRLVGLDTAYEGDAPDDALVALALAEQRILLSKDRGLLRRRALRHAAYVRGERADEQLVDVVGRFAPVLAPFSRCVACNGPLERVAKSQVAERLEPGTARSYDDFSRCRECGRVYWHGAHARRLEAVVSAAVQAADAAAAVGSGGHPSPLGSPSLSGPAGTASPSGPAGTASPSGPAGTASPSSPSSPSPS